MAGLGEGSLGSPRRNGPQRLSFWFPLMPVAQLSPLNAPTASVFPSMASPESPENPEPPKKSHPSGLDAFTKARCAQLVAVLARPWTARCRKQIACAVRYVKGSKNVGISGLLVIGMAIFLATDLALAEKPQIVSSSTPTENDMDFSDVMDEIQRRADTQTGKNWIEPADAVLHRRKNMEWSRYVKTAMHLPDWIDLGLENRTRFESYDHPWRANQAIGGGGTDAQLLLRSRARVGLGAMAPSDFSLKGRIPEPCPTMSLGISGIPRRSTNLTSCSYSGH
jgi:hypothetical protein